MDGLLRLKGAWEGPKAGGGVRECRDKSENDVSTGASAIRNE